MEFIERAAASLLLTNRLQHEYFGNRFEIFFHQLMAYTDPEFLNVRTAGTLGDQGSDGLTVVSRKLFACYAPETYNQRAVEDKFDDDLVKAITKRGDQFDTFVFVHNGLRGIHPVIATKVSDARRSYNDLKFESLGPIHLRRYLLRLERTEIEDLLGSPIPVEAMQFRVGIEDIEPLLHHLISDRSPVSQSNLPVVSDKKLDYNAIDGDTRENIIRALASTHKVEEYYEARRIVPERDLVALSLNDEYLRLRAEYSDPEDILWQLEQFIIGNSSRDYKVRRASMVVLAHFFETCDIFDEPTVEWLRGGVG